jgi:hypothetical protein
MFNDVTFFGRADIMTGHFFFTKSTITDIVYENMLEQYLMHVLQEDGPNDMLFREDGVPLHFHHEKMGLLDCQFLEMDWHGRAYHLAVLST